VASDNAAPRWRSRLAERHHFERHGAEVGAGDAERYTASALATIRSGRRFTFQDATTGDPRIGYFQRRTGRLTVVSADGLFIVTHFRCEGGAAYVRRLTESSYGV